MGGSRFACGNLEIYRMLTCTAFVYNLKNDFYFLFEPFFFLGKEKLIFQTLILYLPKLFILYFIANIHMNMSLFTDII